MLCVGRYLGWTDRQRPNASTLVWSGGWTCCVCYALCFALQIRSSVRRARSRFTCEDRRTRRPRWRAATPRRSRRRPRAKSVDRSRSCLTRHSWGERNERWIRASMNHPRWAGPTRSPSRAGRDDREDDCREASSSTRSRWPTPMWRRTTTTTATAARCPAASSSTRRQTRRRKRTDWGDSCSTALPRNRRRESKVGARTTSHRTRPTTAAQTKARPPRNHAKRKTRKCPIVAAQTKGTLLLNHTKKLIRLIFWFTHCAQFVFV